MMFMLGVKKTAVRLTPHSEQWAALFEDAKREVQQLLGSNVIDIQHIGSTAIKGIDAKPILDVAVVVHDPDAINMSGMEEHGYVYRGEMGIPGRYFFVKYRDGDISTHHVHCYKPGNQNLLDNIAFRDFLIEHPDFAMQYNNLKQRLAELHADNREKYTSEKTDFVKMILELASSSS